MEKGRINWLLSGFVCVSLVIHLFVFLHMAGIYRSRAVSYIELTMHQFSKPNVRHIPQPRIRHKETAVAHVRAVKPRTTAIPKFNLEPVRPRKPDLSYETINLPEVPGHGDIGDLNVPGLLEGDPVADAAPHREEVTFSSAEEYFEMLNLRIHSAKTYPESARSRHLEGRVKVEFTLLTDGTLAGIRVVKSSRHRHLDAAAVEAVKKASPFPRPPSFIFSEPITLRINILFELA